MYSGLHRIPGTCSQRFFLQCGDFGFGVCREDVDGHDNRQAHLAHVLDMLGQICAAGPHRFYVLCGDLFQRWFAAWFELERSAVQLHGAYCGDDYDCGRLHVAYPAFDVAELLGSAVGPEAGFGDHVVGQLQRDLVGQDRVGADCDVGKRTGMYEDRPSVERLRQVRHDGIFHQHRHSTGGL